MDFDQPEVWTVLFQVNYFCFEHIVIFCISDFVLYEYSSFSSSRNSFYTLESGRTVHKNQLISVLFWGPKTWLKLGLNKSFPRASVPEGKPQMSGIFFGPSLRLFSPPLRCFPNRVSNRQGLKLAGVVFCFFLKRGSLFQQARLRMTRGYFKFPLLSYPSGFKIRMCSQLLFFCFYTISTDELILPHFPPIY